MGENSDTNESRSYAAMLQEVETIVAQVSQEGLDLDSLVSQIERGYQLIEAMRGRLQKTRTRLEKLREEYSAADPDAQ